MGDPLSTQREQYRKSLARSLRNLLRHLSADPEVEQVILFGSYARGREDLLTDLDLVVIKPSSQDFVTRTAALYREVSPLLQVDVTAYVPTKVARQGLLCLRSAFADPARQRRPTPGTACPGRLISNQRTAAGSRVGNYKWTRISWSTPPKSGNASASAPSGRISFGKDGCCMRREAIEEGKRWLTQAREDLRWAKHLAEEGAYYLACFLAQQVVEKALKAFLYARGAEMVLGHSVRRLVDQAAAVDPDFTRAGAEWGTLDGYSIPTRYPNSLPEGIPSQVYTARAAREALALAEEAVRFVKTRLEDR